MLDLLGIKKTSQNLFSNNCRQIDQKEKHTGIQISYTDGTKHNLDVPRVVVSKAVQLQKKTLWVCPPTPEEMPDVVTEMTIKSALKTPQKSSEMSVCSTDEPTCIGNTPRKCEIIYTGPSEPSLPAPIFKITNTKVKVK